MEERSERSERFIVLLKLNSLLLYCFFIISVRRQEVREVRGLRIEHDLEKCQHEKMRRNRREWQARQRPES
jgi:hypothetical protein